MKITLNSEEKQLLREVADEYKKETGDIPDYRRIVDLLSLRYENRLKADMRAVLGVKLKEHRRSNKGRRIFIS